jgi:hypothetical protein
MLSSGSVSLGATIARTLSSATSSLGFSSFSTTSNTNVNQSSSTSYSLLRYHSLLQSSYSLRFSLFNQSRRLITLLPLHCICIYDCCCCCVTIVTPKVLSFLMINNLYVLFTSLGLLTLTDDFCLNLKAHYNENRHSLPLDSSTEVVTRRRRPVTTEVTISSFMRMLSLFGDRVRCCMNSGAFANECER